MTPTERKEIEGRLFKRYRMRKGLQQRDLAGILETTPGSCQVMISKIESGERPIPESRREALLDAIGVTEEEFTIASMKEYRGYKQETITDTDETLETLSKIGKLSREMRSHLDMYLDYLLSRQEKK